MRWPPPELRLSPLGPHLSHLQPIRLGGQDYLRFDLPALPDEAQTLELATLAMTRAYFVYYEKIGRNLGPLLRPLEIAFESTLPPALVEARRYRGKTNEDFTHFLCNVARFSSQFSDHPWRGLRIFDPLAGGGTTLFTALILGADAAGVEENLKEVEASAGFVRQFMRAQRITLQEQPDRLKKVGQRWRFTIGRRKVAQHCLLAAGDTVDAKILLGGFKPHLIVTDLPYGIQHQGVLADLLAAALPIWASLLRWGGRSPLPGNPPASPAQT